MQFGAFGSTEHSGKAFTDQHGELPAVPFGAVQLNTAPDRKL